MKRALLSVSNKEKLVELANFLKQQEVEIISTGGTGQLLNQAGIDYTPIEQITGNPESFGGRMKTISFEIGSSILFRRHVEADQRDANALGIESIDLVVCNLYPFEQVAQKSTQLEELIENIDIGGPTMIRAAAKNYQAVTVLTSPTQYQDFIERFSTLNENDRFQYALEAFKMTAHYDQFIFNHINRNFTSNPPLPLGFTVKKELRYGENSHQKAWLIPWKNSQSKTSLAETIPLQGKALSYNNMMDADAAWKCMSELNDLFPQQATVTVIKHANPCGIATGEKLLTALKEAWACDDVSAFGSVIAMNQTVTAEIAQWFCDKFVEIIIAPQFDLQAREVFAQKKNLRLLETPCKTKDEQEMVVKSIHGGLLIQEEDELNQYEFQAVTKAKLFPNNEPLKKFGMIANKYLKSNAITLVAVKNDCLVLAGSGMGQPNRLDSLKMLAAPKAKKLGFILSETLLVSDAFFPFRDSIDVAHEVGIKNIVQPGGSIRDDEVIEACDEFNMAMEFSSVRHFRH